MAYIVVVRVYISLRKYLQFATILASIRGFPAGPHCNELIWLPIEVSSHP